MARKTDYQIITAQFKAFDILPLELRTILNNTTECVDPRYILGLYKTRGLKDTVDYLDSIGLISEME